MTSLFASLLTHGLIVAAMMWFLVHDSGHVEGAPGLAGSTRTRFDVTVDAVKSTQPPAPKEKLREEIQPKPALIREGLELPAEVKNQDMREIDTPPVDTAPTEEKSAPSGQAGSGNELATRLGDSDRTNRLGIYLQKMQRKIQGNLGPAGYVQFPTHAKLLLDLKRDGRITKIAVIESSGDATLDQLAIRAVQKSLPFDPWEQDQQIELPVVFR